MFIQKISYTTAVDKKFSRQGLKKQGQPLKGTSLPADTVSFKALTTALSTLVLKRGYSILKTNNDKANFCKELSRRFSNPDFSNGAKQVVETLFILAKTSKKEEPDSLVYESLISNCEYNISSMRSLAISKLFPLLPEMAEDMNSARMAKFAFLTSLVDTGEYLEHPDFFKEFKSMSSLYDDDKKYLLKRILRDKNLITPLSQEAYKLAHSKAVDFNKDYFSPESNTEAGYAAKMLALFFAPISLPIMLYDINRQNKKDAKEMFPEFMDEMLMKQKTATVALISVLEPTRFKSFFEDYKMTIQQMASEVFYVLENKLLRRKDFSEKTLVPEKNRYYGWYKDGFNKLSELTLDRFNFNERQMSNYESHLATKYHLDFMNYLKADKTKVMEHFNIDECFADDLIKDYEFLLRTRYIEEPEVLRGFYKERIREKLASDSTYIRESASGLLSIFDKREKLNDKQKEIEAKGPVLQITQKPEEKTENFYDNNDDDLESWERADLETPWIVR